MPTLIRRLGFLPMGTMKPLKTKTPFGRTPSLKLTTRTWKLGFPKGKESSNHPFSGAFAVSFREGTFFGTFSKSRKIWASEMMAANFSHWGLLLVVCWQSPTAARSKRYLDLMTNDINGMRYLNKVREKSYTPQNQHEIGKSPCFNGKYIFKWWVFHCLFVVSGSVKVCKSENHHTQVLMVQKSQGQPPFGWCWNPS